MGLSGLSQGVGRTVLLSVGAQEGRVPSPAPVQRRAASWARGPLSPATSDQRLTLPALPVSPLMLSRTFVITSDPPDDQDNLRCQSQLISSLNAPLS